MELIGEVVMNAPRERVWAALNDAAVLQACIPGCEQVVDESPVQRQVRVMVKMGPVRARFNGRVNLSDVLAPERCVMSFEGSGGAAGMASGKSQVTLHDEAGATRLTYTVKASVGGKLGQIGGRMMDASAKQLADQFFNALRAHLGAVPPTPDTALSGDPSAEGMQMPDTTEGSAPLSNAPHASSGAAVTPQWQQATPRDPEVQRLLWFLMGVASTALGVWLGAHLF